MTQYTALELLDLLLTGALTPGRPYTDSKGTMVRLDGYILTVTTGNQTRRYDCLAILARLGVSRV